MEPARQLPAATSGDDELPAELSAATGASGGIAAHLRDVCERGVLFWDALRQRAENILEHERQAMPPLLDLDQELRLAARRLERPVNHAPLRITRVGKVCLVPDKPAESQARVEYAYQRDG
jgi:hypothetical protein